MRSVRLGDYDIGTRERAREALQDYLACKLTKYEQPHPKGRLSVRGLYRDIVKVAKRAGISGMHPHVLRHSCATHCLQSHRQQSFDKA